MRQGGGRVSSPGLSLREAKGPMDKEDEATGSGPVPMVITLGSILS